MLHAFIDESGDDGFSSKSTKWLVIAAFVLHKNQFDNLSANWKQCKSDVRRRLEERLHWKNLDHPAKKAVLRRLFEAEFNVSIVAAHKPSYTQEQVARLQCPTLYCFLTKFLVERLSWMARDQDCKINITFEDRPQVNFDELKTYIFETLKLPGRNTRIAFDHLNGFNCKHFSHETRLEIADTIAGAIGNGLNEDAYGGLETSYGISLLPKIWTRNSNLYSYGLKVCPEIDREKFQLFVDLDAERKKCAPG